jgi:hypothetical protein
VEFHDPLTYPQYFAFEDSIIAVLKLFPENGKDGEGPSLKRVHHVMLQGILPSIKKFELANFPKKPTIKNFPATPRDEAALLVDFLREELEKIVKEEEELPNE